MLDARRRPASREPARKGERELGSVEVSRAERPGRRVEDRREIDVDAGGRERPAGRAAGLVAPRLPVRYAEGGVAGGRCRSVRTSPPS